MRKIIILGAGGFGRQACWLASRTGNLEVVAILDETVLDGTFYYGTIPIQPDLDRFARAAKQDRPALVSAVGNVSVRQRWVDTYSDQFDFISIVDTTALIAPDAAIGNGALVLPQVICSSKAEVGDHVFLGFQTVISHDAKVGDFTQVASGVILNGGAKVGKHCNIGAGAIVLPNVTVGDGAKIGAGAVVARDVPENKTVVGFTARAPMKA